MSIGAPFAQTHAATGPANATQSAATATNHLNEWENRNIIGWYCADPPSANRKHSASVIRFTHLKAWIVVQSQGIRPGARSPENALCHIADRARFTSPLFAKEALTFPTPTCILPSYVLALRLQPCYAAPEFTCGPLCAERYLRTAERGSFSHCTSDVAPQPQITNMETEMLNRLQDTAQQVAIQDTTLAIDCSVASCQHVGRSRQQRRRAVRRRGHQCRNVWRVLAEKIFRGANHRVLVLDAGPFLVSEHTRNPAHIGLNVPGAPRVPDNAKKAAVAAVVPIKKCGGKPSCFTSIVCRADSWTRQATLDPSCAPVRL